MDGMFDRRDQPNLLPYQRFFVKQKESCLVPSKRTVAPTLTHGEAAYLVRQYFYRNLHDRLSTRPFLTVIEKKWPSTPPFRLPLYPSEAPCATTVPV